MADTELDRMIIRLMGDGSAYASMLNQAQSQTQAAAREIERSAGIIESFKGHLESVGRSLTSVGAMLAGFGAAITGVFGGLATAGVMSAGKFEQTTIAFETMLGSASETTKLLNELTDFAAKTPFEMPEIEQAARGLVQFGERGTELMETLNMVGNAAAGTSTDFGMVALIFNQVRGVGKLLTQDFRQLSTRGILSLADLAKHFGVTTEAAQGMLSAGQISFEDLKDVFRSLSAEGGRFANLMEKQSASLLGKVSTLKDAFNLMLRDIGQQIAPLVKTVVTQLINLIEWFRALDPAVKTATAAVIGIGAALGAFMTSAGGLLIMIGVATTGFASIAAVVLPLVPTFLAIAAGITAVGAAVVALVGLDTLKGWWDEGVTAGKTFVTAAHGFLMNFGENIKRISEWIKGNWRNAWTDVKNVFMAIVESIPKNLLVALETAMRLFTAFGGWIGVAVPAYFVQVFMVDLPKAVMEGLITAFIIVRKWITDSGAAISEWAVWAGTIIKQALSGDIAEVTANALAAVAIGYEKNFGDATRNIVNQIKTDFAAGASDINFFNTAGKILEEQAAKLQNPLDTFQSTMEEFPELKFDLPEKLAETAAAAQSATKEVQALKAEFVENKAVREGSAEFTKLLHNVGLTAAAASAVKAVPAAAVDVPSASYFGSEATRDRVISQLQGANVAGYRSGNLLRSSQMTASDTSYRAFGGAAVGSGTGGTPQDSLGKIATGIGRLVEIGQQELDKPTITLEAVGLQ